MSIWFAILLITGCAVCWDVGVVLQKQAADVLPPMVWGDELVRTLGRFIVSKRWMGGLVISGLGWGLFAFALNYTPISLARAIQGSGFVILAVFSIVFLDHLLSFQEWAGVLVVTGGIVALGLSEPTVERTVSVIMPARLAIAAGLCAGLALLVYAARKWLDAGFDWTVVFSVAAGILLGLGDVFTKAMMIEIGDKAYGAGLLAIGPVMAVFYLSGFFILSRGYQHGRAILVTGVSDFCARLVTIFTGVLAMGEAFPEDPTLRWLRIGGLAAILFGAFLLARFSGEQMADEIAEKLSGGVGGGQ